MSFTAKLNLKFYIISALLFLLVAIGWYGIYFLNTNEILLEDGAVLENDAKIIFSIIIAIIVLSWTLSFITLVRQAVLGFAFVLDSQGINYTATAINILAFIFVVPIKRIPYNAIKGITDEDGLLTLSIDKKKLDVFFLFRPFVRKKYHLFSGFTVDSKEEIINTLNKYVQVS